MVRVIVVVIAPVRRDVYEQVKTGLRMAMAIA